jgi:hypothetical protein
MTNTQITNPRAQYAYRDGVLERASPRPEAIAANSPAYYAGHNMALRKMYKITKPGNNGPRGVN